MVQESISYLKQYIDITQTNSLLLYFYMKNEYCFDLYAVFDIGFSF